MCNVYMHGQCVYACVLSICLCHVHAQIFLVFPSASIVHVACCKNIYNLPNINLDTLNRKENTKKDWSPQSSLIILNCKLITQN